MYFKEVFMSRFETLQQLILVYTKRGVSPLMLGHIKYYYVIYGVNGLINLRGNGYI